jgi:hypothetical protein
MKKDWSAANVTIYKRTGLQNKSLFGIKQIVRHRLNLKDKVSYIIAHNQRVSHLFSHAGMVHGHKDSVDDYADCDEHVNESICYKKFYDTSKFVPTRTAFPSKHQFPATRFQMFLAGHSWSLQQCQRTILTTCTRKNNTVPVKLLQENGRDRINEVVHIVCE